MHFFRVFSLQLIVRNIEPSSQSLSGLRASQEESRFVRMCNEGLTVLGIKVLIALPCFSLFYTDRI